MKHYWLLLLLWLCCPLVAQMLTVDNPTDLATAHLEAGFFDHYVCVHGPFEWNNPYGFGSVLADEGGGLCVWIRGNVFWLVDFGGGPFILSDLGYVQVLIMWGNRDHPIYGFNYGVY